MELWVVLSSESFAQDMRSRPSWAPRPTQAHLSEAADGLLEAMCTALGLTSLPAPSYQHAQRWAAGLVHRPLGLEPPVVRWPETGLYACGDWCGKASELGEALESGLSAAEALHEARRKASDMRGLVEVGTPPSEEATTIAGTWPVWSCGALPDPAGQFRESVWWEARPGAVEERCLIREGRAVLLPEGGGAPVTIEAGDWVVFKKGFSCTWRVEVPISKHYAYFDASGKPWEQSG